MTVRDEINRETDSLLAGNYDVRPGNVVPTVESVTLGNTGVGIDAAMFFIDFRRSSKLVDSVRRQTAAKIYKAYLASISRITRENGGEIRNFTGDGILAAYVGDGRCDRAVKAAMQIKSALEVIVQPKLDQYFQRNAALQGVYRLDFGMGIDVGGVLAVKVGIAGTQNNNLIWVGNATNFASKMANLAAKPYNVYITQDVFNELSEDHQLSQGKNMWYYSNITIGGETAKVIRTEYRWELT
jgi:class 3 adenylate cyclase